MFSLILLILLHAAMYGISAVKTIMIRVSAYSGWMRRKPEYLGYDYDNYRYYLGPDNQIGNVYPQYFSRTFYDGLKGKAKKDVVNLVRCAWAGSQRYGCSRDGLAIFTAIGLHSSSGKRWTQYGNCRNSMVDDRYWRLFPAVAQRTSSFQQLLVRWF